eukprot:268810-Pleurochrysis_carterae.AAC.1
MQWKSRKGKELLALANRAPLSRLKCVGQRSSAECKCVGRNARACARACVRGCARAWVRARVDYACVRVRERVAVAVAVLAPARDPAEGVQGVPSAGYCAARLRRVLAPARPSS